MAKPKTPGHLVDPDQLRSLAADYSASRQDVADANSDHQNTMKRLHKAGINTEAFKLIDKLLRMDLLKAQDFMRSFKTYGSVLGLDDRLASQGDILEEAEEEEEEAQATRLH